MTFKGMTQIPVLGDLTKAFNKQVKGMDVLIGALASLAGIWGLKKGMEYLQTKQPTWAAKIPASVMTYMPAIAGGVAGAALYYGSIKAKKGSHAAGLAVGAVAAGLTMQARALLVKQFPQLADAVEFTLPYNGYLVQDNQMAGMLVEDTAMNGYADAPGLQGLAAMSMVSDDDGIEALVG